MLVLLHMHLEHQQYKLVVLEIIQFGFMPMELNLTNLRCSKMEHQLAVAYKVLVLELKVIQEW